MALSNGLIYTGFDMNMVRIRKFPEFTEFGQLKTRALPWSWHWWCQMIRCLVPTVMEIFGCGAEQEIVVFLGTLHWGRFPRMVVMSGATLLEEKSSITESSLPEGLLEASAPFAPHKFGEIKRSQYGKIHQPFSSSKWDGSKHTPKIGEKC
ncbi:uncharacterized protein LOC120006810 [Tripterygium wilfordii]|uniref:uncharacterized protein LOC120006810 n=1 Tax=Tripterygium wilfordii TaxID=458696 RepID=UPI0018F84F6B|nr:uncharacterized protein LOC120006810 [Tripterygium wilfordii]